MRADHVAILQAYRKVFLRRQDEMLPDEPFHLRHIKQRKYYLKAKPSQLHEPFKEQEARLVCRWLPLVKRAFAHLPFVLCRGFRQRVEYQQAKYCLRPEMVLENKLGKRVTEDTVT